MKWWLIFAGGGAGSMLRYAVGLWVETRTGPGFPWGTFAVNISGSFVLGVLAGASLHGDALRLAGTATLGSYTTFSTWMLEAHRLGEDGSLALAVLNIVLSLMVGVGAVVLGRAIA